MLVRIHLHQGGRHLGGQTEAHQLVLLRAQQRGVPAGRGLKQVVRGWGRRGRRQRRLSVVRRRRVRPLLLLLVLLLLVCVR